MEPESPQARPPISTNTSTLLYLNQLNQPPVVFFQVCDRRPILKLIPYRFYPRYTRSDATSSDNLNLSSPKYLSRLHTAFLPCLLQFRFILLFSLNNRCCSIEIRMSRPALPATPHLPPGPRAPPAPADSGVPPQGAPLPQGTTHPSTSYQTNLVKDILRTTILPTNLLLANFLLIPGHLLSIFSQSLYLNARGLVSPEVHQCHLKDISSLRSVHTPSIKKRSEKD